MTVISEPISNIAGADNSTQFEFGQSHVRESDDGTRTITRKSEFIVAVGGILTTPNLDPGLCRLRIGNEVREITIPDSMTAVRLFPLWDAAGVPSGDTTDFVVNGGGISRVKKITVSGYAALITPDPETEYSVIPD